MSNEMFHFWIGFGVGISTLVIVLTGYLLLDRGDVPGFLVGVWRKVIWGTVMHLPVTQRLFIWWIERGLTQEDRGMWSSFGPQIANWKMFRGGRRYRVIHEWLVREGSDKGGN